MQTEEHLLQAFMACKPRSFYHLDWSDSLQAGTFVNRVKLDSPNQRVNALATELDLTCLSKFGEKHLWGDRTEWATACRESICEWIRRERHQHEISRLHCLFGAETLDEVEIFSGQEGVASPRIWMVQAVSFSGKKDMKWFSRCGTLMEMIHYADCYWSGEPADGSPLWEVLLFPSIYVVERVK